MIILSWTWFSVLSVVSMVWLIRHYHITIAQRLRPPIHSGMYRDPAGRLPSITWLVAAKDEESNIESCLQSLTSQDYPDLQIIAINDRSEDETGRIIDRLAGDDDRLTAVHVDRLRQGWFGKNNAMREGVERAGGEWFCFTDADCVQTSKRSLTVAMQYALEHELDFLSVLPTFEARTFWERVIQPACGGIMMIWFNPMKVNDPRRSNAYANGAFMLMRRSCYDAIGGHEPVKTEVNEDMHMARRAKQAGQRLVVVSNEDLYRVRMYASLAEIWSGWSRIFYGCFESYRRLILSSLAVLVFTLVPWLSLIALVGIESVGAAMAVAGAWLPAVAAVACLAQMSVMARFYALSRIHPLYAALYPIGAIIGLGTLVNAMRRLHGRKTTTWRGTTYRGDQVESQPETALPIEPKATSPDPSLR
ncbi:MAG: glycosyltransferase family 2 protein, partial [Planctomycetota bacterium]|nr:glycosyltransferase family 2 protein [Planctomycetota bacterium]